MKGKPKSSKNINQLIWGVALALAGVAVLLRNLDVMPQLAEFESFSTSVVVIFYFIGLVLIYGGLKKIILYFRTPNSHTAENHNTDSPDS